MLIIIHDCFNRFPGCTVILLLYQTFGLDGKYRRCLNRGKQTQKNEEN